MRHLNIKPLAAIVISIMLFSHQSKADVIVAKDTVYGTVIGKNKEPLPGAKVEIVGQPVSAFTDIDGHFRIKCEPGAKKVLVSYPKARDVKKKIAPDMTVQIGRTWREAPEHYQWFVGGGIGAADTYACFDYYDYSSGYPQSTLSYDADFVAPNISVQAGRVKKVGWYAKYMFAPSMKDNYYSYTYDDYNYYKACSIAWIVGGMVRLGCPLHLKLGAGVGYTLLYSVPSRLYPNTSWQIDLGLLFRIKDNYGIDLSMNVGATKNVDIQYASMGNFSFVYFFNK